MIDFIHEVSGGLTVEEYTKALREAGFSTLWDTPPKKIEMDHESQMDKRIGSEPLIPTRGISLSQFIRPQKDQVSSSPPEPSRLQRLPDEILLMIISCVSDPDDKPSLFAFFALRQVSCRFRRLLQAQDFITHPFSHKGIFFIVTPARRTTLPFAFPKTRQSCRMDESALQMRAISDFVSTKHSPDIQLLLPSEVPEDGPLFVTSCDHPEHKVPCNYNFDYTDQTPRVFATNSSGCGIILHILWQGHSGSDRSILHQSGYLHRHKLNDSLRRIRQNGGQLFLPQRGPNTLPEWNAISEIDRSEVVPTEEDLIKLRGGCGYMNRQRRHNLTFLGPERIAKSYVYNGPAGVPEACNNDVCRNHHVGKEDQVDQWIQSVNRLCEIGDDRFGNRMCSLAAEEKQSYEDDRRTFESCEDHKIEEPEEALAPREPQTRFNLHSLTMTILRAFDWQYWQTGRAQLSTD
ncbi:hypothetical protein DER46DRAFT_690459 [Fusarium sp. MPI-SDFR-AT-0072]|nr:hypothetical protein DER46DRAFT_690459 [Fusarium sp. MPI-SDFR-AT-0072]